MSPGRIQAVVGLRLEVGERGVETVSCKSQIKSLVLDVTSNSGGQLRTQLMLGPVIQEESKQSPVNMGGGRSLAVVRPVKPIRPNSGLVVSAPSHAWRMAIQCGLTGVATLNSLVVLCSGTPFGISYARLTRRCKKQSRKGAREQRITEQSELGGSNQCNIGTDEEALH